MWNFLSGLLSALTGRGRRAQASTVVFHAKTHAATTPPEASAPAVGAGHAHAAVADAPSNTAAPEQGTISDSSATTHAGSSGNSPAAALPKKTTTPDTHVRHDGYLEDKERELLARISNRIAKGDLELPQLPSTSMAVIDMTSKGSAEISDIVKAIESDPVLSSEIVKTANSALYSGAEAVETITASVVRIGLRNLRTLMFSLSMRSTVLRDKRLASYGEEVWRQAYSTASISRGIAKPLGVDADRAFLLGLLADIGKVSLLAMLRKEIPRGSEVSPALVGRVFYLFHEIAGARLAEAWHMPADFVAVAKCHHHFADNEHNKKDAALVSLAIRLDLLLSQEGRELEGALQAPEMEFLELPQPTRQLVLDAAIEAHDSAVRIG